MKNCRLINTTLAFEYSSVDAEIDSYVDSIINPSMGTIKADSIGELIMEKDEVDVNKTKIICKWDGKKVKEAMINSPKQIRCSFFEGKEGIRRHSRSLCQECVTPQSEKQQ